MREREGERKEGEKEEWKEKEREGEIKEGEKEEERERREGKKRGRKSN